MRYLSIDFFCCVKVIRTLLHKIMETHTNPALNPSEKTRWT